MSFSFAPKGWALCNGQLLPINQNQALFALLGTTFGGDGRVNFALPDFRARTPIHAGGTHTLGERGGEQAHTLTTNEIPGHTHSLKASSEFANSNVPGTTKVWANSAPNQFYNGDNQAISPMKSDALGNTGSSQAHLNMQPFLTINFSIALQGIFPSPT